MSDLDFSILATAWPLLWQGFVFTLEITAIGFAGGVFFGSLLAIARLSENRALSRLAAGYITLMRSLPLILVIFWVYFLAPWAIGWLRGTAEPIPVGAPLTVFATFVLFESAYFAEIVRAGVRSLSPGQFAAAQALGFTKAQAYIYIILPQAFRNVLPILLTQTIILFQDTSLVYVISATDLLGAAFKIVQRDFRPVEMYLTVAVIYFVVCFAASQLVKSLQLRLSFERVV